MTKRQIPWVEKGYSIFANEGPSGLKVERLAKEVGKNKSSFYHHFADLEVFTSHLLDHHLHNSTNLAAKETKATNAEELISILLEHKVDLLFNRQLRVHREIPQFEQCFTKVNEISIPGIIPLWSKIIGLSGETELASLVLHLSLENFFIQITSEALTKEWLKSYFKEIESLVSKFKKTGISPF